MGWWGNISKAERENARNYMCDHYTPDDEMYMSLVSLVMRSRSNLCVIPLQDYIGLDNTARMNQPSTVGINWKWRLKRGQLTKKLQKRVYEITKRYDR